MWWGYYEHAESTIMEENSCSHAITCWMGLCWSYRKFWLGWIILEFIMGTWPTNDFCFLSCADEDLAVVHLVANQIYHQIIQSGVWNEKKAKKKNWKWYISFLITTVIVRNKTLIMLMTFVWVWVIHWNGDMSPSHLFHIQDPIWHVVYWKVAI